MNDSRIEVYSKKHINALYAAATGKQLQTNTLTRLVKNGKLRKIVEPGNAREHGVYYKTDIDAWIQELREFYDKVKIVA